MSILLLLDRILKTNGSGKSLISHSNGCRIMSPPGDLEGLPSIAYITHCSHDAYEEQQIE